MKSLLSAPDGVMELDVLNVLTAFLSDGQTPSDAASALTTGYHGFAEICNVLCEWLLLTGHTLEQIREEIFLVVKQMVLDKYRPMTETVSSPPSFVTFMTGERRWRPVIYALAEKYPQCTLMQYSIDRIAQSGFQDELAQMSTQSASSFFPIFNQAIANRICEMVDMKEVELQSALPGFQQMCCQTPNTYIYAQLLLLSCAKSTGDESGKALMRLYNELEEYATKEHSGSKVAANVGYTLQGIDAYKNLAAGIVTMLYNGKTNPADVLKIHDAYSKSGESPPLYFLHNATLLNLLVTDLFDPRRKLNAKHISKYVFCLAVASCGHENSELLKETISGITMVSQVCKKNSFGSELASKLDWIRYYMAKSAAVSMGLICWIKSNLFDSSYYVQGSYTLSLKTFLQLLVEIAATHPLQRPHCWQVISGAYEAVDKDDDRGEVADDEIGAAAVPRTALLKVKKDVLVAMVDMMCCSEDLSIQILLWTRQLANRTTTDKSLIRHFLKRLFYVAQAPYSSTLAEHVLHLIDCCIPTVEHARMDVRSTKATVSLFEVNGVNTLLRFLADASSLAYENVTLKLLTELDLRSHPEKIPKPKLKRAKPKKALLLIKPVKKPANKREAKKKKKKKKATAKKSKKRAKTAEEEYEEEMEYYYEQEDEDAEWKPGARLTRKRRAARHPDAEADDGFVVDDFDEEPDEDFQSSEEFVPLEVPEFPKKNKKKRKKRELKRRMEEGEEDDVPPLALLAKSDPDDGWLNDLLGAIDHEEKEPDSN